SIASTLTVLHATIAELVRFQSLLVVFLQQITPYVDTRDRDVAGLLRGLSGAINAVADEAMRRSETMLTRDRRRELRVSDFDARMDALQQQMLAVQQALEKACPERDAHPSTGSGGAVSRKACPERDAHPSTGFRMSGEAKGLS